MNKKLIYILFSLLLFSCVNEDYLQYDITQKDGVYLDYTPVSDSIFYNFGFESITEYTFYIKCNLMGVPKSYDRKINLRMVNSKYANSVFSAAKESYYSVPAEVTLAKDSVSVLIPVKLKRDPELENTRAILTMELLKSDDFDIRGHAEYTITFDDKLPATPAWWQSFNYGAFSKLKGQLFFKYFWEMEQENKGTYDIIVARWGKNLNKLPNSGQSNPLNIYRVTFMRFVQQKMWDYSQANPQLNLGISKPNFN